MAIVTFVIAAISMGVAIYSAFRAGGLRERSKWYHRAHEAMARDGKSLRSLSSDPGTVTLRIEDVVAMTAVDSMVSADILRDLVKALRIIDADIGLKNSILSQAKEEGGNLDGLRRSICDGEALLTKYAKLTEG